MCVANESNESISLRKEPCCDCKFDAAGRLQNRVDAHGNLKYEYGPRNSVATPVVTSYQYNAFGQATQVTLPATDDNPEGSTSVLGYDAAGQLVSRSAPAPEGGNRTTEYQYDAFGRQRLAIGPADEDGIHHTTQFTYDLGDDNRSELFIALGS